MALPETLLRPSRGLDHCVLAVRDLDAAEARFQALGFTTTPRARHPWGTENVLVQMHGSFIELLGLAPGVHLDAPAPGEFSFGYYNQQYLRDFEGMSMLVFSSLDAEADGRRWRQLGLETYAPFDFSRTATLADGRRLPVAFSLAFVSDPRMPRAVCFVCQQRYPENFWKPEFMRHDNGAQALTAVTLAASDPGLCMTFVKALFREGVVHSGATALDLDLHRGRVRVSTPGTLADLYPGIDERLKHHGPGWVLLDLATASLEALAALLGRQGISYREIDDAIVIAPAEAFGLALRFSPAD